MMRPLPRASRISRFAAGRPLTPDLIEGEQVMSPVESPLAACNAAVGSALAVLSIAACNAEPGEDPGSAITHDSVGVPSADAPGLARGPGNPAGLREFRDCAACPLMVELPPGTYLMGATELEADEAGGGQRPRRLKDIEKPRVEVDIRYRFAVGKFEVTFDEWDRCVADGGCTYVPDDRGWGREDRPVIHVSSVDVRPYLAWLREVSGQPYRLLTSSEWEYAARAGTSTAYWWGDDIGVGNVSCDGCGGDWDNKSTAPVGTYAANPWGLHDMLGNVNELVADCWVATNEGHPLNGSAVLEASPWWEGGECKRPTWRGGDWASYTWALRAAWRSGGWLGPDFRSDHPAFGGVRGFRVARTIQAEEQATGIL